MLQVSGVGDRELLERFGVECVHHLPGVGQNLHDHLQIRAVFRLAEGTVTLNQMARSVLGQLKMGLEYALWQTGPLSMAPSQLGAFARSSPAMPTPDLQYHVQPLSLDRFGSENKTTGLVACVITNEQINQFTN